ncbi:putative RNA 2'-phosphotransferase [Fulvitalea axinellae]|uniref:Probable RNA 2'-phosphotransferase n=1 Tax=Fulvitalea axinellae TaxID=1182444 RepID=A0AAU9CDD8_9BACT|nr:putative RNA 2'-phosphotransferase [Fulvitalea axinellae]
MIDEKKLRKISKFLSLVLRHKPETIGIALDGKGWTEVAGLLEKMKMAGRPLDMEMLEAVVEANNKKRFAFNADKTMIRANQGHSVNVELGYTPVEPPEILFHGTARKNIGSIFQSGLEKRGRHHVHLSAETETAVAVGQRHGKPVVLEVRAKEMRRDGYAFFVSDNGVWLTEEVPTKYLVLKEEVKS